MISLPKSKPDDKNETRDGRVALVGAGPGDPDLMTVAGLKALKDADVVMYDRLIPHQILEQARGDALLIDVGKQPGKHRVSQREIQRMLVEYALDGKNVVRLKGGDPFIFGRGYEEFLACRENGIVCEIIPGVTSAIAGPAAAGIPVTLRGVARTFAIVTVESGHQYGTLDHDWEALARLDTLSILMGRRTLADSASRLIEAGKNPDTPVACVERATFSEQRVIHGNLKTIGKIAEQQNLQSPMVTVVGDVADLAKSKCNLENISTNQATNNHGRIDSTFAAWRSTTTDQAEFERR